MQKLLIFKRWSFQVATLDRSQPSNSIWTFLSASQRFCLVCRCLKLSAEWAKILSFYFSYQVNRCVFNYQSSSTSFRLSSFLCGTLREAFGLRQGISVKISRNTQIAISYLWKAAAKFLPGIATVKEWYFAWIKTSVPLQGKERLGSGTNQKRW